MKAIYIPKGETVHYESLVTKNLVVNGCLIVDHSVEARHISGTGVILAGNISADAIRADELKAASIVCEKLIAKRVTASEVFVSQSAAVSCRLSAGYVRAGKLTVGLSDINDLRTEEVINLPVKRRGLLGTLFAAALRSLWLSLTVRAEKSMPVDAEYTPSVEAAETATPEEETQPPVQDANVEPHSAETPEEQPDFELQRFIAMFKLARESGYTLRVVPGTPEENAPVFDFVSERITHTAA